MPLVIMISTELCAFPPLKCAKLINPKCHKRTAPALFREEFFGINSDGCPAEHHLPIRSRLDTDFQIVTARDTIQCPSLNSAMHAASGRFESLFCARTFHPYRRGHVSPRRSHVLDDNIIGARAYPANGQIPLPETVQGPDVEGHREGVSAKAIV